MTKKTLGAPSASRGLALLGCVCVCVSVWCGCGDDAAPSTEDGGPRVDLGGRDLGPAPEDGFSPSVRCATNEECVPAMNAAPCALTFCDRVNGRCVTTGPDSDADGHADEVCDPGLGPTAVRGDDCDDVDPMRFPGRPETCDDLGFDEDCDSRTVGGGRPGDGDTDGDGFVSSTCTNRDDATGEVLPGPDCDDSNAEIHPRAVDGPPDTCNGVDDNCDGDVDPGCTCSADMPCGPSGVVFGGASVCTMGVQRCSAGTLGMCEGAVYPRAETCEIERLDDDCDGVANEPDVCECDDGSTGLCGGAPDGAHNDEPSGCRRGSRTCVGGRWQTCEDAIGPSPESCEGRIDEDCDGTVDEDCGCTDGATRPCGTDTGECTPGTQTCSSGGWGDCSGGIGPMPEVCDIDRRDENCDGSPNEGCTCASGETRSCGLDTGECFFGTEMCSGGVWSGSCTGGRGPAAEVCDGDDDDCNGTNDDGCSCTDGGTRPCGTDVGDCESGVETCSGGAWGTCAGGVGPVAEICDGAMADEDCDGMRNEACACLAGQTRSCGGDPDGTPNNSAPAICRTGTESCQSDNTWGSCLGSLGPGVETCDSAGLDDDCDGTVNEGCHIVQMDSGSLHSCAVRADGRIRCWGANSSAQLGTGSASPLSATPVDVVGVTDAVQVTVGAGHTCARRSGGQVVCWGDNMRGQLGLGTSGAFVATPTLVPGITAIQIDAGGEFTCVVGSDSVVRCWGVNSYGQCSGATLPYQLTPLVVSGTTGALQVSSGANHACAVLSSGSVMCWGCQHPMTTMFGSCVVQRTAFAVPSLSDATAVSAAIGHSCARRSTGQAVCWGINDVGQLGNAGTTSSAMPVNVSGLTNCATIAAGGHHSCATRTSGGPVCWGFNLSGQVGNGSSGAGANVTVPTAISGSPAIDQLAAGGSHTCARLAGGTAARCWGSAEYGQIGNGTSGAGALSATPVAVTALPW